jgi:hypothetical protein
MIILFFRFLVVVCISVKSLPALSNEIDNISVITEQSHQEQAIDITTMNKEHLGELSEEERHWYGKFQNGLIFFSGWKEISEEILAYLPPEERSEIQHHLEVMGVRIGTEWAKANSERKIDTDQLHTWGNSLRKARKLGARQLSETIKIITLEVDAILEPDTKKIASDTP